MQLADTPSPQSATLGLHPVAVATTHAYACHSYCVMYMHVMSCICMTRSSSLKDDLSFSFERSVTDLEGWILVLVLKRQSPWRTHSSKSSTSHSRRNSSCRSPSFQVKYKVIDLEGRFLDVVLRKMDLSKVKYKVLDLKGQVLLVILWKMKSWKDLSFKINYKVIDLKGRVLLVILRKMKSQRSNPSRSRTFTLKDEVLEELVLWSQGVHSQKFQVELRLEIFLS